MIHKVIQRVVCSFRLRYKEHVFQRPRQKTERQVEYPWVFKRLMKSGRLLDIGCLESNFADEVSRKTSLEVYGIDIRVQKWGRHYTFVRCDVRYLPFRQNVFDEITVISTLEHVGLLGYENSLLDLEGDKKALSQITRVTRKEGVILLTLPYGKKPPLWYKVYAILKYKNAEGWMRIYNWNRLSGLMRGLRIECLDFFVEKPSGWRKASHSEAEKAESKRIPFPGAVVCVKIRK